MEAKGKLTLVATPMGNLGDLSPRGQQSLLEADVIAAEDTRQTLKLMNYFAIKKPMISYYKHKEEQQAPKLLKLLAEGKSIALVSDAGTPGISDPGQEMLQLAVDAGFEVDAIPGCCALVQGLVLSGLSTERFAFEGFLPRGGELKPYLTKLCEEERTLVFYESPHRIKQTLGALLEIFGEHRQAAVCRELTKKFQEVNRGTLLELHQLWLDRQVKGEFVLVIAGAEPKPITVDMVAVEAALSRLLAEGVKHKAAAKEISSRFNLPANQVYQLGLTLKKS